MQFVPKKLLILLITFKSKRELQNQSFLKKIFLLLDDLWKTSYGTFKHSVYAFVFRITLRFGINKLVMTNQGKYLENTTHTETRCGNVALEVA